MDNPGSSMLCLLVLTGLTLTGCSGAGDCEPGMGTFCEEEESVVFSVDGCGELGEVLEVCNCGCTADRSACELCGCEPSCAGRQCGSDGCGDNKNCGSCDPGWTCNPAGTCVQPGSCNNGQLETYEECEGFELRGKTCQSLGFDGGELVCTQDCILDTSGCGICGNEIREPNEHCDADDLGGATCESLGFAGGELSCTASCTFNPGLCEPCGNGTIDGGETCDGADLGGATCQSLGYADGTLACSADCESHDTSSCTGFNCDDQGYCEACMACVFERDIDACASETSACADDPECQEFWDCHFICIDNHYGTAQECKDQCTLAHPDGLVLFEAWAACLLCDPCFNDCNDEVWVCP